MGIKLLIFTALLLAIAVGCSLGSAKQTPESFIKDFMPKHFTLLDTKLADYYVSSERDSVLKTVNSTIAEKKQNGTLMILRGAEFNLSDLNVEVLNKMDAVINNEPHTYVRVKVSGTYSMRLGDELRSLEENETFILRADGSAWKVTETENPWS